MAPFASRLYALVFLFAKEVEIDVVGRGLWALVSQHFELLVRILHVWALLLLQGRRLEQLVVLASLFALVQSELRVLHFALGRCLEALMGAGPFLGHGGDFSV